MSTFDNNDMTPGVFKNSDMTPMYQVNKIRAFNNKNSI